MSHLQAVERILRYLKTTLRQGLVYKPSSSNPSSLIVYFDADYVGSFDDRHSTSGFCTYFGGHLITWCNKKQSVVACSLVEAEYHSMVTVVSELTWMPTRLKESDYSRILTKGACILKSREQDCHGSVSILTLYGTSIAIPIGDLVQILSDSERRAHYDIYLFSKKVLKKKSGHCSVMYTYKSPVAISKPDEVVEWLEWYKHVIHDIVTRKKVATGFGYFDELESELYSAIHFAYHGPVIDSMNMLPNSFEAEERSLPETSEVLHLVSGRSLFGIICTIDKVPELSHPYSEKLSPFETSEDGAFDYCCKEMMPVNTRLPGEECFEELKVGTNRNHTDVYSNMELHISGKLVATATRSPNCKLKDSPIPDNEDHINVFLNLNGNTYTNLADPQNSNAIGSKILLGTITGLGNNAEGICSVYDRYGQKTHVIIKHRTFLPLGLVDECIEEVLCIHLSFVEILIALSSRAFPAQVAVVPAIQFPPPPSSPPLSTPSVNR
ncbi:hypothetical protein KSP39_PZI021700 [Platanthera zijinensis]|uniref:Uncharacterized protein n=1 Tax=Platanthera zijinensis TaxID=2320716 RepID=A0AAP0AYL8_9ASPA